MPDLVVTELYYDGNRDNYLRLSRIQYRGLVPEYHISRFFVDEKNGVYVYEPEFQQIVEAYNKWRLEHGK